MARSKPYVLGEGSFVTDDNTVQRTPQIPIPSSETSAASAQGYLNQDGSINYANVYGKGNYEFLGAPDSFKQSLVSDPSYFNNINNSTGGIFTNATFGVDTNQLPVGTLISNPLNDPDRDPNFFSTSTGASEILKYPLNNDGGGYDFLKITTHELNRSDLLSGKAFKLKSPEDNLSNPIGNYIALPMQPGISDSNSVDWGADQLNPLQLAGARVAGGMIGKMSKLDLGGAGKEAMAQIQSSLKQAGLELTSNDITSYFAGQAVGANIFTRSTGKVINPNLELLFRGPQLRTFNYSYRFTPREEKESKVIKQIIRHFKKHMAARRNDVGLFLKTPYVFKLTYVYSQGGQHPFLNKIKPCALTNFNVDYTPDGSYATYTDGSMTSYTVSMQFSEIAPIYEDDYKDTDNDMGY